jgi:hypothetical protein
MGDIFEAIEQLSVVLSLRLENTVRKRGWAGRPIVERFEVRGPERSVFPVRIAVTAPLSHSITFVPADQPSEDCQSWAIAVKRSDGVIRRSFSDGLTVRKVENGHQMFVRHEVLSEPKFRQVIEDLAGPSLAGHAVTIAKAFKSRFGSLSADVYEILFTAQHQEQRELMHEAVLTGINQLDVETELGRLSKWQPDDAK